MRVVTGTYKGNGANRIISHGLGGDVWARRVIIHGAWKATDASARQAIAELHGVATQAGGYQTGILAWGAQAPTFYEPGPTVTYGMITGDGMLVTKGDQNRFSLNGPDGDYAYRFELPDGAGKVAASSTPLLDMLRSRPALAAFGGERPRLLKVQGGQGLGLFQR